MVLVGVVVEVDVEVLVEVEVVEAGSVVVLASATVVVVGSVAQVSTAVSPAVRPAAVAEVRPAAFGEVGPPLLVPDAPVVPSWPSMRWTTAVTSDSSSEPSMRSFTPRLPASTVAVLNTGMSATTAAS